MSQIQKELNTDLFGPALQKTPKVASEPLDLRYMSLEKEIGHLRKQIDEVSQHFAKAVQSINEFIKTSQSKLERLQQQMHKYDQGESEYRSDLNQKLGHLSHRLSERKVMEQKIQEMMDRHQSVLRSYEVRMTQLQKIMTEKEAQLISANAALNDAKMEISRLKRL